MADADPRLDTEYVQTIPGERDVTLVGAVHDHPASVYRVRTVVAERDPDVLGLELPPLAVPLYEAHAVENGRLEPGAFGGEMRAAVEAAATDDVVGIDGPTVGFCRRLARRLVEERVAPRVAWRALRELGSVAKTTALCRVAAAFTARTSLRVGVGDGPSHGTTAADPPAEQARDERGQVRTATAVLDAIEPPASSRCRSRAREAHMADRLATLRERGDVVAVVGVGHFASVRERLEATD